MSPAPKGYVPKPSLTAEEFWAMTDRSGECWEWTGNRTRPGYGSARFRGTTIGAHRVAWMLANDSEIPPRMMICHHCDNPPCVNPAHLYCGTASDNARDAYARGLMPRRRPRAPRPVTQHDIVIMPGQAANLLGVSTKDLARMADSGALDAYKFDSGHRRYIAASVRSYATAWESALSLAHH
jgi:HNH endonuclease